MAMGLGALTEGLQSGISTRNEMDRGRHLNEYLRQRNTQGAIDLQETYDARRAQWEVGGGDVAEFDTQNTRYEKAKDPALLRLGKWLGQRIGFGNKGGEEQGAIGQADFRSPEVQMAGPQGNGVTTYGIPEYADGGRVDEERMKRSYGDYYVTEDEARDARRRNAGRSAMTPPEVYGGVPGRRDIPTSGGGPMEFLKDLGRSAAGYFDDTRAVALEGDKDVQAGFDRMRNADSAREAGAGFTDWAVGSARAGLGTAAAVGKDAFIDNPITQFAGGALGFDGQGDAPAGVPDRPSPEAANADKAAATEATVAVPERSNEEVAQQALSDGEVQALENLDYKLLVDQGVSPEELPSMTTQDWSGYRREMMDSLIARGMNPKEALEQVDYMTVDSQMRGFNREGRKALLYLQSGQSREAAMALRQAYQYFPNGVGVKFGIAKDPKTKQPSIIAMGVDEKTGEPTGKPMLITAERLGVMMENMANPAAFRTWTKDGRDLQLEINQLQSVDDYRQGSLAVAEAGAITDRMGAQNDAVRAGSSGGLKPSDVDRRSEDYRKWASDKELLGEYEEGVAISLADAMDRVTRVRPDIPPNTVIKAVEDAWKNGGELGVVELLQSLQGK